MSNVDRGRLETLLKHWVQHNREHSQEFRSWAKKTEDLGEVAHDAILAAAQQIDKANEFLFQALDNLKEG
jgi:hypothetical protein